MVTVFAWVMAAAATTLAMAWGLWHGFWKPYQLVRAFTRQGISRFPVHPLQASSFAEGWSWNLINDIQKHGNMFYVKFGIIVGLVVLDPSSVQQLLTQNADCYEKGFYVRTLKILGNGIFRTSGNEWIGQRQLLEHCFLMRELKDHFQTIKEVAKEQVERWSILATEVLDVHTLFLSLTVRLICHVAFGERIDEDTAMMIAERFNIYLHQSKQLVCSPFFSFFGYRWKRQKMKLNEIHLLTSIKNLVCRREELLKEQESKQGLAIDLLIQKARESEDCKHTLVMDNSFVMDNSLTLLLAGHETTANLLTWTVYLLGTHLNWQEKARAEARGIEDLTIKSMNELKILKMILWESLRLYPPQPIIGRRCVHKNSIHEIIIPEGVEVIIPVSAIHRNKDLWGEDFDEFKPARFANGINKACNVPSSFMPFGSGPRTCIGQNLALFEAKIILYYMLKNYAWEISPGYQHSPDITLTLQPQFGMPIILVRQ